MIKVFIYRDDVDFFITEKNIVTIWKLYATAEGHYLPEQPVRISGDVPQVNDICCTMEKKKFLILKLDLK